ncbi:sialidase family protein [Clostridium hydrogenum]|uniref:sialidase family protein n=1 Tax=Clostridium hydrogenum TaxID=2855764 RepID=UPI001F43D57C|nr:sialidase family protein [Clostridium hydrogenum]
MNRKLVGMVTVFFMTFTSTMSAVTFKQAQKPIKVKAAAIAKSDVTSSTYKWNNVKIDGGGYVPAVIFNPTEKGLVYARTDMGGAYRWDAANNKWIPITDWVGEDDWNLEGCTSLATDPVETNRVYIAAGMYTNSWTDMNGYILRSEDKGNTWQRTELPFKLGGNEPGRGIGERLAVDPNNDKILYLAAPGGNGLWRSEDYGATWSQVKAFPNVGNFILNPGNDYGGNNIGDLWVTFDPSTGSKGSETQTIYVGVADKNNSIYCSNDGGKTWSAVQGQPTGYLPHHGVLGSNGMLYITYSDSCGPYDGTKGDVWRYDTKNKIWTNISPVTDSSSDDYFGYGGISVDAQHPNTLMVAALNSWWPDGNVYRSTDGGKTWSAAWKWDGYPNRDLKYTQDISASKWLDWGKENNPPDNVSPKLGWMMDDIEIDPFNSDHMLYGTGATLYGTDDLTDWDKSGGKITISVKADGIEETSALALISPPEGAQLISGLGDICGFRHDDITKVPTKMLTTPTFTSTTSIDYAELNPSAMVRVGDVNRQNDSTTNNCGFSNDGGKNWWQVNSNVSGTSGGGTVAMSSKATSVVWSPQGGAVSYSTDSGSSWKASNGIPKGALVASDRVNTNKFYALSDGNFYISTDGGASFIKTGATALPKDATKANIKAVPGIEGDIWLSGEGGIWHSTDSGVTFNKLSNVQDAISIGLGKAAPGKSYMTLYSAAKINNIQGIFRSDDEGKSWIRINDDEHQYGVLNNCITGDPRIYGRVYIGTNGRGVIYGDIDSSNPV